MANKSRYSLRSSINEMGTIASRTRSRSSGVILGEEIGIPTRKRGARVTVKTEPLTSGVFVKVEPREPDCSSNVEESVEATPVQPVEVKVEPPDSSNSLSNSPRVVPKVEFPESPVSSVSSSRYRSPLASPVSSASSSRSSSPIRVKVNPFSSRTPIASSSKSSSPIFLKAEPSASSSLSSKSSVSSISSGSSRSSLSSTCSSFHLPSPSPPRRYNRMSNWDVRGGNSTSMNDAPGASKVKVWDVQNGQYVIRELPLVATEQPPHEQRGWVSTYRGRSYYKKPYYKKPYYKKPYYQKPYYRPYWQRNNRGGGRGRWQCRCNGACSSCGAITEFQANDKPVNIHCNIVINTPSTQQPSSVHIEELTGEGTASVRPTNLVAPLNQVNASSLPVVLPIPVFVAQPSSNQTIPQISYNYMGHSVSCSARFH